ncbi:hypothetical protein QOZ73_32785, partial [Pseudomonas aeruginosa]|uniref:hypothetical protein n=1 Tax=Pseudomonas aeruginosa TaxID=287 RepID=UPI003458BD7B
RLSMGHKLALSSGVSGETGTGAGFEAAGGSAAAEVLASQKASAEKKKLLIEDWELANYYQSKFVMLAEKSAAERLAVEKGLSKALTAME